MATITKHFLFQLEEVPALKERMRTLEAKHENLKEVLSIKIQAEK